MYCCVVGLLILNLCRNSVQMYVANNVTSKNIESNPAVWTESGIWGPVLEDWVIGSQREARVTQIIPIQSVLERSTLESNETKKDSNTTDDEMESKVSHGHKIVNNSLGIKRPPSQITETNMFLLNAIEKLVFKMDFMEKRLQRVEEMLYFAMAGNKIDQDPCPDGFNRAGMNCYLFAGTAGRELDWKQASKQCKKFGATLAEMETIEENQDIITYMTSLDHLRGREYWTGGLNPGLLWIWSNSARPVKTRKAGNKQGHSGPTNEIVGNGRCLRLTYNPALSSYSYRGSDCASRYSYICEIAENSSSNELRRLGRSKKVLNEL